VLKSKIILCADDFALNAGCSAGILKLLRMQRLSAVSCIVNSSEFSVHAQELHPFKDQVKIGLHFNLTEGYLLSQPHKSCFTLNELLIKTHLHALNYSLITTEFLAQLDQFTHVMQQLPDFIDGHQHVHQFPIIRQIILDLYDQKLKGHGISIRSTWPSLSLYPFKSKILGLTGGKALKKQLINSSIPHNAYFGGIYDFSPKTNYPKLFRAWLKLAKNNTLIMCHPGEGSNPKDVIAPTRVLELDYFSSDEFLEDCEKEGVSL
jgi:predicted glycoside hydrolase/deacetylase ChbG (UPF0249 family)